MGWDGMGWDGWMDVWMYGCVDVWMYEYMDVLLLLLLSLLFMYYYLCIIVSGGVRGQTRAGGPSTVSTFPGSGLEGLGLGAVGFEHFRLFWAQHLEVFPTNG